ncbi:hypothetical protein KKC13_05065 [bacterium]|nr:hypothetical protein [bacterium]MBU1959411.1 hypothetical protein [bacterium]
MKKDFIEIYNEIEKSKKLNFLKQLLLKDSDLQEQFIAFTADKKGIRLDTITAVNIDKVRDELWSGLSAIDVEEHLGGGYYDYYDDEGMGESILEPIFNPFVDRALSFADKANYLDAFMSILAIYELNILEEPEVNDDEYFVFGEDIESFIQEFIDSSISSFTSKMEYKVLSVEVVDALITLFFERYLKYKKSAKEGEEQYFNISSFNLFFEQIIDEAKSAKYLLEQLKECELDKCQNSAIVMLHCADILEENELYLKVANEFFLDSKEVALRLQKKYKALNDNSELARVSNILLEQERNSDYALFVIENIDKEESKSLYIKALEIYIKSERSFEHYKLLKEYFSEDERLEFIKYFKRYNSLFYIELLEEEKQYKTILDFAKRDKNSHDLYQIVKPIITIYPDEVFELLTARSDKLVEERGRNSYARACELLQLASIIPMKKEALHSYVTELYGNNRRLSALRDELGKAGLL